VLVDLHAHYPMHVIGRERADTRAAVRSAHPDGRWKAIVVDLLSRLFNSSSAASPSAARRPRSTPT
jgi:hypothetical protein